MGRLLLQCISDQHVVNSKCLTIIFVNYTSINLGGKGQEETFGIEGYV